MAAVDVELLVGAGRRFTGELTPGPKLHFEMFGRSQRANLAIGTTWDADAEPFGGLFLADRDFRVFDGCSSEPISDGRADTVGTYDKKS